MIFPKKIKLVISKQNRGFAMLFAVLISSVLISIGLSIFNISIKELNISSSARDSLQAYYAGDSARECAIYWDTVQGAFPACLDQGCSEPSANTTVPKSSIVCAGNQLPMDMVFNKDGLSYYSAGTGNTPTIYKDFFNYSTTTGPNIDPTQPRSDISITKTFIPESGAQPSYISTVINTFGHNTGIIGRRVERGMSFTYTTL